MLYKFCPKCSGKLAGRKNNLSVCGQCGFHFYVNPNPTNAAILINKKGEILLTKRKCQPKKGYWDLPGGFINPGETAEESVKREVKEELGVTLKNINYLGSYCGRYYYQGINLYVLIVAFVGKIGNQPINSADDVSLALFFAHKKIPFKQIAFNGVKQAIKDYFKNKKIKEGEKCHQLFISAMNVRQRKKQG